MSLIDRRRRESGISISEFARLVGISRKTYYDRLNDDKPPLDKYAERIARVLGVGIEDLSESDKVEQPELNDQGVFYNMKEMRERIKWAINNIITTHGLSNVKLAGILGLSTSTVDAYRRGLKVPKAETLVLLQNLYKISLDWLADGTGGRFLNEQRTESVYFTQNEADSLPPGEFVFIPQMAGTIMNGGLTLDRGTVMRIAFRRDWISQKGNPENMSLIKVQGDSMEPTLISGDLVLVDHSKELNTRGGLFAITIDQEILIKRLQPLMGNKLLVISDNQKYSALEISVDDIKINGKIIWFGRELDR